MTPEPRTIKTPEEIAADWYDVEGVCKAILESGTSGFGSWPRVPSDVCSTAFAEWLTIHLRAAMAKGIQIGRGDVEVYSKTKGYVVVPCAEMRLMIDIIEAAVNCVSEWKPSDYEKECRGRGTGVGMRAAEDRLIREVRKELPHG